MRASPPDGDACKIRIDHSSAMDARSRARTSSDTLLRGVGSREGVRRYARKAHPLVRRVRSSRDSPPAFARNAPIQLGPLIDIGASHITYRSREARWFFIPVKSSW